MKTKKHETELFLLQDSHNTELEELQNRHKRKIIKINRDQLQALADVRSEATLNVSLWLREEFEEQASTQRRKMEELLAQNRKMKKKLENRRPTEKELDERPDVLASGVKGDTNHLHEELKEEISAQRRKIDELLAENENLKKNLLVRSHREQEMEDRISTLETNGEQEATEARALKKYLQNEREKVKQLENRFQSEAERLKNTVRDLKQELSRYRTRRSSLPETDIRRNVLSSEIDRKSRKKNVRNTTANMNKDPKLLELLIQKQDSIRFLRRRLGDVYVDSEHDSNKARKRQYYRKKSLLYRSRRKLESVSTRKKGKKREHRADSLNSILSSDDSHTYQNNPVDVTDHLTLVDSDSGSFNFTNYREASLSGLSNLTSSSMRIVQTSTCSISQDENASERSKENNRWLCTDLISEGLSPSKIKLLDRNSSSSLNLTRARLTQLKSEESDDGTFRLESDDLGNELRTEMRSSPIGSGCKLSPKVKTFESLCEDSLYERYGFELKLPQVTAD